MRTILALVFGAICWMAADSASADQKYVNENGQVVHSSPGPVIMHRILPPYGRHVHVYGGRVR